MIKIYFDGACQPKNPNGHMGIGVIVYHPTREILYQYSCAIMLGENGFRQTSNNVAEYLAIIEGMRWVQETGTNISEIEFLGDSQLVVKQMNGEWNINSGIYSKYALEALELKKELQETFKAPLRVRWISRDQNSIADELSTDALVKRGVKIVDFSQFKKR